MSPLTQPSRLVLSKGFTPQSYMYQFPLIYPVWHPGLITTSLWLDAADASTVTVFNSSNNVVSQWRDKSGNSKHFSQGTQSLMPTYQSSSIVFDGSNDFLTRGAVLFPNNLFGIYCVAKNGVSSGGFIGGQLSYDSQYVSGRNLVYISNSIRYSGLQIGDTSLVNGSSGDTSLHLYGYELNGPNAVVYNENGNAVTSSAFTNAIAQVNFTLGAGAPQASGELYSAVTICEIVCTSSPASTTVRQKIEGYLAHKWGLTANLPANHPYKTVGPTP